MNSDHTLLEPKFKEEEIIRMDQRSEESKKEKRKDQQLTYRLYIFLGIVVLIWSGLTFFIFRYNTPTNAGLIGDSFGVVNALFSSLAFAFLIYTAHLQKRQLEYQRKDLNATRLEITRTAEAQEEIATLTKMQLEILERVNADKLSPELLIHQFEVYEYDLTVWLMLRRSIAQIEGVKSQNLDLDIDYDESEEFLQGDARFMFRATVYKGWYKFAEKRIDFQVEFKDKNERLFQQTIKVINGKPIITDPITPL